MGEEGSQATTQPTAEADGRPLVEAIGVAKRFGPTRALEDVSVTVKPSELHGLVGRNGAGKSTLVKILTGLHRPDTGRVLFGGEEAPAPTARDAWLERVACVYQRPTIVPALTVAENLFLNAVPGGKVVNWKLLYRRAEEELEAWDIKLRPDQETSELNVEQRQLVEIVRALRRGSRFIILDEPTAQLDAHEIEGLFTRIRQLQEQGVSFLFISHHLEEIYELCQTVTVLRDGRHILTAPVSEVPQEELIAAMVGEEVVAQGDTLERKDPSKLVEEDVVLRVEDLTIDGIVEGVSLSVRAGECVGLAGQASSGKSAVGDAIVGLLTADSGDLTVGEDKLEGTTVPDRIAKGIGYLPEDRHERGLIPDLSVEENCTMSILGRLSRRGVIRRAKRRQKAEELIDSLAIKASSPDQPVSELSGGNQQKTVMGRALASNPRALVLIRPTAGVDIASKEALYGVVRRACADGAGALLISDEIDELAICDRILVMVRGSLTHEFAGDQTDDHELVAAMEGVEEDDG
jgi:simple sugar transport system ATP-binding protein